MNNEQEQADLDLSNILTKESREVKDQELLEAIRG